MSSTPSARAKADAFLAICPSRAVLTRLADKWAMLVLVALAPRPMRFGELRRRLEGVSAKVLTQTLRALERDGLLRRDARAAPTYRVDYELTASARKLVPIVQELKRWAEESWTTIERANTAFDRERRVQKDPG